MFIAKSGRQADRCRSGARLLFTVSALPPGQYGGPHIESLFTNCLDWNAHPYFREIEGIAGVCTLTDSSQVARSFSLFRLGVGRGTPVSPVSEDDRVATISRLASSSKEPTTRRIRTSSIVTSRCRHSRDHRGLPENLCASNCRPLRYCAWQKNRPRSCFRLAAIV